MQSAQAWTFALLCMTVAACTLPRGVLPSNGTDTGLDDGGMDGSADAGTDAGLDADLDGGRDVGLDMGIDVGTDGGDDAGPPPDAWTASPIGSACSDAVTCASGFCVDGVCCESACDGVCESCTAAVDGTCAPAPLGSDPEEECAVEAEATCGTIGVCDGARACARYGPTTVCAGATCSGSTQTNARTCDGAGTCASRGTRDCAPFACDGTVCSGSCAGDGDCASGLYCIALTGACAPRLVDGQVCTGSNQCSSGQCVDGVCCESACGGACQACSSALTGAADGACAPVLAMTDPGADCAVTTAASCGTTGLCNASGACAQWPVGTVCAAASCASGTASIADTCNGAGVCNDNGTFACGPYVCGATSCGTSCTGSAQCATGHFCAGAVCMPLRTNGESCTVGSECASTSCVDSVCCDSACVSLCQACTAARRGVGSDGTCGPIVAGTDPDSECAAQSATTCGTTGSCSGSGGCALHAAGTTCASASCAGGLATAATTCDGAGTCVPPTVTACSPYACGASACLTSCADDAECLSSGDYCTAGGACVTELANGSACVTGNQCTSMLCVDGVCCGTACGGTCQSCAVPGSVGSCTSVPLGQVDPPTCAAPASCSGVGACLQPDGATCAVGAECLSGHCTDGVCCGSACNGTCESCSLPGSVGTCTDRPDGTDPDDECAGLSTCDGTGSCTP